MNKRNTEGYVLVYLLVAITVIGLVASALMASTLKVMQAQEQSLVYMQEKYAVQGELERFISDLSHLIAISSFSNDGFQNEATAKDAAARDLSDYLNDRKKFSFNAYPLISTVQDDENNLIEKFSANYNDINDGVDSLSFSIEFSNSSVAVNASATVHLKIKTEAYEKVDTLDDPTTPSINEYTSHDEYKYMVLGVNSLAFDSYSITSIGGGTR